MEPIFEAVLANDPSRITPAAAAQRMDEDLLITDLHWLYRGDTPLHLAAAGLRYAAARALLAAGTPVNAVNRRGAAALHYACDPRPLSPTWNPAAQQRIIELLLSAGATVDLPDRGGVTALHRAVRARSPAAVAALLSAGADPRAATGKAGSTPLHLAVAPTGAGGVVPEPGRGQVQGRVSPVEPVHVRDEEVLVHALRGRGRRDPGRVVRQHRLEDGLHASSMHEGTDNPSA